MLAPAKINLTLEILARRDDGYHNLRSVMVPVGLADELEFTAAAAFSFASDPAMPPADNLVVRALDRIGLSRAPVAVTLHKHIPVGAGLGGGSSDAAAALRAAMSSAIPGAVPHDWLAVARELGSDVPFFLADGAALVEGTGERVTALGRAPAWWVVLAVPPVQAATGPAYARLARARAARPAPTRPRSSSASLRCGEALQRGDYATVLDCMTNDFEPSVREAYDEVDATLRALDAAGAPRAMLSGSGGACFALFEDEAGARAFARRLRADAAIHVVPFAQGETWSHVPAADSP